MDRLYLSLYYPCLTKRQKGKRFITIHSNRGFKTLREFYSYWGDKTVYFPILGKVLLSYLDDPDFYEVKRFDDWILTKDGWVPF